MKAIQTEYGRVYEAGEVEAEIARLEQERDEARGKAAMLINGRRDWNRIAVGAETLRELCDSWLAAQWQPIETAPRDGTEIFAYWGPWRTESGMAVDSNCYGTTMFSNGIWHEPGYIDDEHRAPTHWRALPPPPSIGSKDSA